MCIRDRVTVSRASCKAIIPFSIIYHSLMANDVAKYSVIPVNTNTGPVMPEAHVLPWIDKLNQSGRGLFAAYLNAQGKDLKLRMRATATEVQQIVFHAIFGSQNEDLNVLRYMTGVEFKERRQLNN